MGAVSLSQSAAFRHGVSRLEYIYIFSQIVEFQNVAKYL